MHPLRTFSSPWRFAGIVLLAVTVIQLYGATDLSAADRRGGGAPNQALTQLAETPELPAHDEASPPYVAAAPVVSGVSISSDPGDDMTYRGGDTITVDVQFESEVFVVGLPELHLEIGTGTGAAIYQSGAQTRTLRFAYTVAFDDEDADGISIEATALKVGAGTPAAAINDMDGVSALPEGLDLSSHVITNNSAHRVDGDQGPVLQLQQDAAAAEGANVELDVEFTEDAPVIFDVVAEWEAISGTATLGVDFLAGVQAQGTVTIPEGSTSATIELPTVADEYIEELEWFQVSLTGAKIRYMNGPLRDRVAGLGTLSRARVNIHSPVGDPTDLRAMGARNSAILYWRPPPHPTRSAVVGYRVEQAASATGPWETVSERTRDARTTFTHQGLEPNQMNHYRVAAVGLGGNSGYSNTASVQVNSLVSTPPAAPTDLVAAGGDRQISLRWLAPTITNGAAVSGYRVERQQGERWIVLTESTGTTDPVFVHRNLAASQTVTYRVAAVNLAGYGDPSDPASARTDVAEPAPPSTPRNVRAAGGRQSVQLSWEPPLTRGGAQITGYRVDHSPDGRTRWASMATVAASATSTYRHTGLPHATDAFYRVAALNPAGAGPTSLIASARTDVAAPTRLGTPTAVSAHGGAGEITVRWTAPVETGGTNITGYQIQWLPHNESNWRVIDPPVAPHDTAYTHRNRDAGVRIRYRVATITSAGISSPSIIVAATTDVAMPSIPQVPDNLTAHPGTGHIELRWSAPTQTGGAHITGYQLEWATDGGTQWTEFEEMVAAPQTRYVHRGLAAATTVHHRIRARNAAGLGPRSATVVATTLDTAPTLPSPPPQLTAAPDTSRIELRWLAPRLTGEPPFHAYRIEQSPTGTGDWTLLAAITNPTTTEYVHEDLAFNQTVHYRVRAESTFGDSPWSEALQNTTGSRTLAPPGAPRDVVATGGPQQTAIRWMPAATIGSDRVLGYRIEQSADGSSDWQVVTDTLAADARRFVHTGLSTAQTVHYRVAARNRAGFGPPSAAASATTDQPIITAPGAPTGLAATGSDGAISLRWDPPTNTGGAGITDYRVQHSETGASGSWMTLIENTATEEPYYVHVGLPASATRYYRVAARTAFGLGVDSVAVNATTYPASPALPDQVRSLTATAETGGVRLAWQPPASTGGVPVLGYRIQYSTSTAPTEFMDLVADTGTRATTYFDVFTDATRTYQVCARNRTGEGPCSAAQSATAASTAATPPGAPTNLRATSHAGRIVLDWDAPSELGTPAATGYRIEVSRDGGYSWVLLVADIGGLTTNYEHRGLSYDQVLRYRVSAVSPTQPNPTSTILVARSGPPAPSLPGSPLQPTVDAGPQWLELQWSPPSDTGNAPITNYRVEYSDNGFTEWTAVTPDVAGDSTSLRQTGLADKFTRHYRVAAINAAGTGPPSVVVRGITDVASSNDKPAAPVNLVARGGSQQITLTWERPPREHDFEAAGYRVEERDGDGNWGTLIERATDRSTTYTHTQADGQSLGDGVTKIYRVAAISPNGVLGDFTEPVTATTDAAMATVPEAPTGLTATGELGQITLAWTAPAANGGRELDGYLIEVSADGRLGWRDVVAHTGITATTYRHAVLTPVTTNHYRVSAINAIGTGAPSAAVEATTTAITPRAPAVPTELRAFGHAGFIELIWEAPPERFDAPPVTGYRIEHTDSFDGTWVDLVPNSGSTVTRHTHEGLPRERRVYYRVSAINIAGVGLPSAMVTATTDVASPTTPGAPINLQANPGEEEINLSWTATTLTGGSAVSGYRIQHADAAGGPWSDLRPSTGNTRTSYTHTRLGDRVTKYYRVAAINAAGVGPDSNVANATTLFERPSRPGRPTGLVARGGYRQITLTWDPPAYVGNGDVSTIQVQRGLTEFGPWAIQDTLLSSRETTYSVTSYTATNFGSTSAPYGDGETYHYRVAAVAGKKGGFTVGAPSVSVSATTDAAIVRLPDRPTNVTANVEASRVTLRWNPPLDTGGAELTAFRVDRSTDASSDWQTIGDTSGPRITEFVDIDLPDVRDLYYRVWAVNPAGVGLPSAAVDVTTRSAVLTVPAPPVNVRAVGGVGRIELAWAAPGVTGNSPITGYRIEQRPVGQQWWSTLVADTATTTTSYAHTGLRFAQTNEYRISARNTVGISTPSDVVSGTTNVLAPTTPEAPEALTATGGVRFVELTWQAPVDTGGSRIEGYRLQHRADSSADWAALATVPRQLPTTFVDRELAASTTRQYRVLAFNAVGDGAPSDSASATTEAASATLPGPPLNLTATGGANEVIVRWRPPIESGDPPLDGYQVEHSDDGATDWQVIGAHVAADTLSYTHTQLGFGVTGYYRVAARSAAGESDAAPAVSATTNVLEPTAPGAPIDLSARSGPRLITLQWRPPRFDGGAQVAGYRIRYRPVGATEWQTLSSNTNSAATTYRHYGLLVEQAVEYQVLAINAGGLSPASATVRGVTDAATISPPGAPIDVRAIGGPNKIVVQWADSAATGGSTPSSYQVQSSADGMGGWSIVPGAVNVRLNRFEHAGLAADHTVHYRVFAINSAGGGPPSAVVSGRTAPANPQPPAAPTGLRAVRGDQQIALHWSAPTDTGGSGLTGYKIKQSADGTTGWMTLVENSESLETTYTHANLGVAQQVHYQVYAINSAGTSAPSAVLAATSNAAIVEFPSQPRNLTATTGVGSVTLNWEVPEYDGGTSLLGYRVDQRLDGGEWDTIEENTSGISTTYTVTGLSPSQSLRFRVYALNPHGESDPSATVTIQVSPTPTSVPGQPQQLMANGGLGHITLTWTAPSDLGSPPLTTYRIEQSPDGMDPWTAVAEVDGTAQTYTHQGRPFMQQVSYRVAGINSTGMGDWSAAATASTAGVSRTIPGTPRTVRARGGAHQIAVSWAPPPTTSDIVIENYQIEFSVDGESDWDELDFQFDGRRTSVVHSGLQADLTLHYRVTATSVGGTSPRSDIARATTNTESPVLPGAPLQLTATGGPRKVDLRWSAPVDNGGGNVTGYRVEYTVAGQAWTALEENLDPLTTEYEHTGLEVAQTVHYRVFAINAIGRGAPSTVATAVTDVADPELPSAPTALTAVGGPASITLQWQAPAETGGAGIQSYAIEESPDGTAGWTPVGTVPGTETTYTHEELGFGVTVYYKVSAANVGGTGPASEVVAAVTDVESPTRPASPTAVQAAGGVGSITITWTAPSDSGGTQITGYRLEHSADGATEWTSVLVPAVADLDYVHGGLSASTQRHYRISTITTFASSDPSESVIGESSATVPVRPSPPRELRAIGGLAQVTLQWSPPDTAGEPIFHEYRIEHADAADGPWTVLAHTKDSVTQYVHVGLRYAQTLHYQVSAVSRFGRGDSSPVQNATTIAALDDRPEPPTRLIAETDFNAIRLQWQPPPASWLTLLGYKVERSATGIEPWTVLVENTDNTTPSYRDSGLGLSETWYYRVSAVNPAGVGDASRSTAGITSPLPGAEPEDADINGDGRLDEIDAAAMYYVYALPELLVDARGGFVRYRVILLGQLTPNPSTATDADYQLIVTKALKLRAAGGRAPTDFNRDAQMTGADALIMYYAFALDGLLGDGVNPASGHEVFRRGFLGPLLPPGPRTDADYRTLIREVHDLATVIAN